MIMDRLENAALYEMLHARFAKAFAFLRTTDLQKLVSGRHEIEGDQLFASVDVYKTKPREEGLFEAHRRYLDIQYIISGRECIGLQALTDLHVQEGYSFQKDFGLYTGQGDYILLDEGHFMVLYPHEGHKPGRYAGAEAESVKKVVVKVLCD